jgi:hypothetical protein
MKKLLIATLLLLSTIAYSQTYKSTFVIKRKNEFESEYKNRLISITDKEISITEFSGGTYSRYFVVNKIVEKDWIYDGLRKTYYCTTKDKDPINGYQKAIIYKTYDKVILALFADEITVFNYQFDILGL